MNNIVVYHASYTKVENIDLSYSKPNKDFGVGFYVTTDYSQAKRFAKLIAKRNNINKQYINSYILSDLNDLEITKFKNANVEWLKCVASFRNNQMTDYTMSLSKKDVIIGKVADDDTSLVLNAYIKGAYGDLNDKKAIEAVIQRLMVNKLTDQICFKSKKSLNKLKYIDCEIIENA